MSASLEIGDGVGVGGKAGYGLAAGLPWPPANAADACSAKQNNLPLHIRRRSRTRSQSCILATTNGFLIWSWDPLPGVPGRREQRLHYFDHFVFAKLYQLLVILVKIYANRFTTGFQSPAWNCRSRLTVGYQGLSSRPFSQRQSASVCKRR